MFIFEGMFVTFDKPIYLISKIIPRIWWSFNFGIFTTVSMVPHGMSHELDSVQTFELHFHLRFGGGSATGSYINEDEKLYAYIKRIPLP